MSGSHETPAIEIAPVAGPVNGSIRPPGSKSITNRALICAALAEGASTLSGALESEDTQVMIAALKQLGLAVDVSDRGRTLRVNGCGGKIPASAAELFVANSGTSMRFLTAMATIGQGVYKLDGIARGGASGRSAISSIPSGSSAFKLMPSEPTTARLSWCRPRDCAAVPRRSAATFRASSSAAC